MLASPWNFKEGLYWIHHGLSFCNSVISILFSLNALRMNGQNSTEICIHINIDQGYFWTVMCHFLAVLLESYSP